MTHEELEDAIPLYAVGTLERGERQAIEAHLLSGCVSCHGALKEYQSVAVVLPFGLNITAPPRTLKAQIMAARTSAVTQDTAAQQSGKPSLEPGEWMNHLFPPETPPSTVSLGWVIGLAVVAVMAAGGYLAWTAYHTKMTEDTTKLAQLQDQAIAAGSKLAALRQQIDERDKSLADAREELERQLSNMAELKDQLIQREAELDVLKAQVVQQEGRQTRAPQDELAVLLRTPNVTAISLAGTELTKQAAGILLYDIRTQKAWLYALHLPECPTGMTYQLWAMHEKPVSVGTFHVGSGETSHVLVKPVPNFMNAKKFSVSLEPIGGRPQPSGPLYLLSQS
jgi:anti-sigma-K factor RskA